MRRPAFALLLALGCGGTGAVDGGAADVLPVAARVELGTGTSAFVAIPDEGAELELVAGPQGGFHVDVTARIWGVDIDRLLIAYEATPVGGTAPISVPTEIGLTMGRVVREGDHWLRAGDFLQLDVRDPAEAIGVEADFTLRVRDRSGRMAEHTRRATIVDRVR